MSDESTKIKRSKRFHSDKVKSSKQVKIAKQFGFDAREANRYNKKHVLNCGNPNCVMCGNPRKFFGHKTIQEQRMEQMELWKE